MARQYKFTTAVNKVRKNNNDTGISNFDEAVESIRANRQSTDYLTEIDRENRHKAYEESQRQARLRAIELAKTSTSSANAGDNRTTEYNKPQTMSVYGGLGTLPNPTTQGMNTAANGANIDYSKVNENASKGWKGISALNGTKAKDKTISQEESLAHATEVMKPYTKNAKAMDILNRYSELEDSQDRNGMLNFQSIGAYSGQFDKLANDFINETGVSMDEFRQIAENYSYIKHSDERNAAKAKKKDAGIVANIAQGIGEAAISPLTNYQAMIGAMQNPNDPELGRDYNSPFMKHLNAQADTKEAFEAKTESLSPVAKTLANLGYDLTVTGTQSAAAALTGEVGLGSFAAGGYSQTLQESDERGLSEGQAQVYSAISGGLEYITERLPIEHLKKIYNGNIGKSATGSLKPYIKAALEQMGEEASEELVNGIADTITDGLINGDKSKVNTAIQNNINSGMSEEEATKSAYLDVVKNTGYSMLVAALSTGVSAGPALATQAIETTRAGRDIIKDNKPLTRDTESSYYISEDRSDYVADEDYEQAQDARQTILNASEKSDKGERVSGKEARAVYEKATRALESLNARRNVEAVKAEEGITNTSGEEEQVEYKAPEKTNEEIIEDIEFASTPYQLAQAIDQVTEETDEIKELIEYKRQELEMYNFKSSDVDNAVTEKKAFEMGQRGEAVSEEQLNAIPEADRQKILEANNQAYNKSILAEHPDAVADTRTGKYFVPEAVKINGADVVIIDSEGNEHTDYSNPRINQALSVATLTSKDARGHLTSESMYKSTPRQAAYAIGLAIKSPEATSALIRTAVEAIYNSASVGHTTFEEFEKNSKGLFTKVDRDEARFLYNAISEEARKSDTRKTENTEGKKTSEKAVSDTLREALPEETTALLEALSNKIGYNFVASTNKNARGSINPGTRQISIGTNSIDEVWSIVAHEAIGEYLQAHGKEDDVLAIQDDMFKYLEGKLGSDAFNDLINQYQSVYRTGAKEGSVDYGKSRRAAANEMFNDTIFALLSSEEGVKDYVAWLNEGHEKSFLEKVKDFFNKIVESIRNYIDTGSFNAAERAALEMDYDQAKAMRDRIFKAMDEAIARANNNEESNDNSNESVEETVRNSFAGINSKTADRQMLERAKDMFYEDMNDIDILAETGWFLGADNYWRYEIADNDAVIFNKGNAKYVQNNKDYARYNELMDKIFFSMDSEYSAEEYAELEELDKKIDLKSAARKTEGKLPDFLYHEELYKAYPFLENVNVKIEKSDFFRGQFNQKTNTITISADLANNIITDNGFKSTLMHEVQHAIQAAEGFASGSTENYWKNHKQELLESDKEDLEHAKDRLKDEQERAKALNEPTSTQEFADQYNLEYLNEDFDNELERFKKDFKEWRKGNIYYYEDIIKKLQRHIDLLENYSDRYLYEYTAGEIEARDVQDRLDYTKEERRRNLPNQEVFDTVYANDRMISGRRYSIKVDSEGRELSEGQQEYFKNSKVVDEEGRLKVVYHGSMADFNIFDLSEARDTEDIEAFFFSGDYEESSGYGNVREFYLNIINPADYNTAYDIFFKHKGKEHAGRLAREELQSMGYDGVIAVDEDSPEYTEYLVFNSNQIKRVGNKKPTVNPDIRKSIKVDWDKNNTYKVPERTYDAENFFNLSDEEMDAAEKQDIFAKSYIANIIHSKNFAGLMFIDNDGLQRLLTKSTRKGYDWQLTESRDGEPIGHDNYINENDDVTSYDSWPRKTLAALYNDMLNIIPMEGTEIHVIREGIAENARNSIKVYGEASPYADSINETKVISTMLGSMNNSLSQVDAFNVSNDAYMQIEKSILNKYNAKLEEGELAANVSFAFAYMQQNKLETNYDKMMNYLLNIGDEVIKNSNLKDPESEQMYNSAKDVVKKYTFKLSEADRQEIKNAFGGNWKSAFGELQKAGIKLNNEKGVDIDTVFSQLQEEFLQSAGINLEKYDKPSEQILGLLDAMHALEPTAYLWDGANSMDKALTVVSDIINDYYSIATGQLASNVVKGTKKGKDIITAAINKEKSKLNQKFKEYKDNKTDEFNQIVAEKNRIIQEQQQKLKAQNEQMKKWNAELSETERKLQQGKLLTEKQVRQTAKLQAKEAVESYRQREERARQIENIKKTGIRLIKWLDNPTDNQHVPKFLQRPLAEFLSAIDFLPKNAKADSKSTLTWQQRMQSLRQALVKIKDAEAEADGSPEAYFAQNMIAKELLSMMDDFLGAETFDEFTQSYIVTKRAAKKVSLLDAKELATLNKIMSALSASINNMNKTYANAQFEQISKLARESVKEVDALPAKKDMQKMLGRVFNFLNFDEVEPITYFEGLGSGAKSVYQELRDGFNLKTKHVREADAYMDAAKKELGITDKELSTWKNQLHTFKLTEGTVMLNTTQIMSLYKIIGRRQGKPHVAVGGIKSADFEYKDGKVMKKHHQAKAVHIRASEANAIINTLTPEQKALADKMQKFMASDCAKWGNRVTEKMFGYKKYEEEDYFPLKTDAHSRATTASSDNNVSYYTIKNSSFTKPITPMANNAVVLDDIFDVFTDHVVSMADYDAYVMPIADAMRWFNYSERVINAVAPDELNEQGARLDYIGNMQESIDRVYGDAGLNYFRQFIKDINGDYAGTGGTNELLSSLMSMYKAQAVGANMRVVIQQPTAVVRASDVIEPTYLLQAMASLPKAAEYAKKAQANSEIAYWKAQGYYETYLGQSFKEIITGDVTLKDKFNDWSGYLAGKADDLSWGIMYKAAELKTAKEQPELKGSAFDKAATKLFEDIVDHTQVVDTIFHKSQYMRNQGTGYKVTSAFMAEPTKTYNMLYRAYRDAKLSGNQSFKVKRLRDVALIFLFEQILNAIITGGWDVLRDDEKTNYIESFREHFTENALDNLNPLNLLPIAKEITSAIQGYDATAYTIDAIYTAVDSFNALLKIAQGKSNKTTWGNTYQIAKATSQLTGVPVANVMREFKTIYNLVNDFWGGKDLINSKTIQKKVEKTKETNRLSKVFEAGDLGSIKSEITNTYNNAIADGKEESEAWKATREMLKSQYQLLVEANPDDMAAINNRFKTLLKYTKKADGKGGYRVPSDKEVANWIDNWKVED